ncbi:hypothetical protein FS749_012683, partial [Ceratobasidium sp. UAMH 11750]
LVVLPFLLVAWSVLFASLNGICTAIYAFGDARQLYPYELYVIRCRAAMGESYAQPVDYKKLGDSMMLARNESIEPIIQPHALFRPKFPNRGIADKMRRFLSGAARRRDRDVEQGGTYEMRSGAGRSERGSNESARVPVPVPANPTFPTPAYIPTSPHPPIQQCPLAAQQPEQSQPLAPPLGGFSITSLRPKAPPIPPNWGPEQRATDLDIGDPRALGVYSPMVNIPSGFVRRVHRDIFMRSMWMAVGVTVPIVIVLLVIPVRS